MYFLIRLGVGKDNHITQILVSNIHIFLDSKNITNNGTTLLILKLKLIWSV